MSLESKQSVRAHGIKRPLLLPCRVKGETALRQLERKGFCMRFIRVFAVVAVLAGITAGAAYALAFDDKDSFWPNGEVGTPYFKQLIGHIDLGPCPKDSTCKFSVASGELPPGISLASDGKVTGTPTALGTWYFWLRISATGHTSSERYFNMVVNRIRLRVGTTSAPGAVKGNAYSLKLAAVGGSTGYTWTLDSGTLPAGLTLSSDGTISGTPTTNETAVFVVKVTDSAGKTDTHQLTIKVVDPLGVKASPRVAEVGRPFSATLQGSGGSPNYTFAIASGLPSGLNFDGTAAITGTPTRSGIFALAVSIKDADGLSTSVNVPLMVVAKLSLVTSRLHSATVGAKYGEKLRISGGARPLRYAFAGGKVPKWLHIAARTGTLSGTPTVAGSFRFRVAVTDALGAVSTRSYNLSANS